MSSGSGTSYCHSLAPVRQTLCLVDVAFKRKVLTNQHIFKIKSNYGLLASVSTNKNRSNDWNEIALYYKNKTLSYTNFPWCCQVSESLGISENVVLFGVSCPFYMMI